MKGEDLYQAMEHIDDQVLERKPAPETPPQTPLDLCRGRCAGGGCGRGSGALAQGGRLPGGHLCPANRPLPQLVPRPDPMDYLDADTQEVDFDAYSAAEEAYQESQAALEQERATPTDWIAFLKRALPVFLSGKEGENAAYSPLNVYMALAMLAEVTDGESRQQILDLLGSNSLEDTREQAKAVWEGAYQDDGATATILASSVWLRDDSPTTRTP